LTITTRAVSAARAITATASTARVPAGSDARAVSAPGVPQPSNQRSAAPWAPSAASPIARICW
jgi:hypothetical protein